MRDLQLHSVSENNYSDYSNESSLSGSGLMLKMMESKNDREHNTFLNKLKDLIKDGKIVVNGKNVKTMDDLDLNITVLKRFLFTRQKDTNPQLNSRERIKFLNSMSDKDIIAELKKINTMEELYELNDKINKERLEKNKNKPQKSKEEKKEKPKKEKKSESPKEKPVESKKKKAKTGGESNIMNSASSLQITEFH